MRAGDCHRAKEHGENDRSCSSSFLYESGRVCSFGVKRDLSRAKFTIVLGANVYTYPVSTSIDRVGSRTR